MTLRKSMYRALTVAVLPALALCACSDNNNDDEPKTPGNEDSVKGRFAFATTIESTNGTAYDLITGESLDNGILTLSTTVCLTRVLPNGCSTRTISML